MAGQERQLKDLVSVGPETLKDLAGLRIRTVAQLASRNPLRMYQELCKVNGPQDICCLDVFRAAVAQARNPDLPAEQCQWWTWSESEKPMPKDKHAVTTPDLVILSLLAERPMHGYEVNAELERRQARDWVAISRPQIYYSLEKLTRQGLLREFESSAPIIGAERRVLETTKPGRAALARELESEHWSTGHERPPFLTWLALSWQASPETVRRQFQRRREFLERELAREEETIAGVRHEVGHEFHEAVWMLKLTIQHIRTELAWLIQVEKELEQRAPAHRPPANPQTNTTPVGEPNASKRKGRNQPLDRKEKTKP